MSLILSGTDGLSDVDGSAATPAIRGTDANTGMFFPAADTIAFSEGGVESMRLNSSGVLVTTNDASISGLTVGKGAGAVSTNTAVGNGALFSNTSGSNNAAFGTDALYYNTTGSQNTAIGRSALVANTSGPDNTAMGFSALNNNTTGGYNVAVGRQALIANTTADYNTAVGYQAGFDNTTGTPNTYVGAFCGHNTTTGGSNTFLGYVAAFNNTTGANNVSVGRSSMENNTTGNTNTAIGANSLYSNTTASNNTAVGYQAGYLNTTAGGQTFVGYQAGFNATGSNNTAIGSSAGTSMTTGTGNTCIGSQAGQNMTTGVQNTFIGGAWNTNGAGFYVTTGSKNTIIGGYDGNQGGLDIRTASNYIVLSDGDGNPRLISDGAGQIGTGSGGAINNSGAGVFLAPNGTIRGVSTATANATTTLEVYSTGAAAYRFYVGLGGTISAVSTTITGISDQRVKENIIDLPEGLDAVMALKPRKFDWKEGKGRNIKGDRGFIAQEFETVFPDMIEEWKDSAPEGEEPYKAVNANLIPTLVKAIQELNAKVEAQALEIATLKGN